MWINMTDRDCQITFAQLVPSTGGFGGQPEGIRAHVVARVVLAQNTAQELLVLLAQQLCRTVSEPDTGD